MGDPVAPRAEPREFRLRVQATLRDTDGMGHVNNAVYLSWLEEIRTLYVFERRGLKGMSEVDFVLASAHMQFRSPVYLLETIELWCAPSRVGRASWDLTYEARAARDDRLVLEARTVQVHFDYEKKVSVPIPDDWRRMLEEDLLTEADR